jgi:hypothetical protein
MRKYYDFKKVKNGFVIEERDESYCKKHTHVAESGNESLIDFIRAALSGNMRCTLIEGSFEIDESPSPEIKGIEKIKEPKRTELN